MATTLLATLLLLLPGNTLAGDSLRPRFEGGLCFRKMAGSYWTNGLSADYTGPRLAHGRLHLGAHLTTSLLGSAMFSNALPLHQFELYAQFYFRPARYLQPFVGWNAGVAMASYGSSNYDDLPAAQMLMSPAFGLSYIFTIPLRISGSVGYNVVTGNGSKGIGVVYPLFGQLRVMYRFSERHKTAFYTH